MEFISHDSIQLSLFIKLGYEKLLGLLKIFTLILVVAMEAVFFCKTQNSFSPYLILVCLLVFWFSFKHCYSRSSPVFLVDFSCLKPPDHYKVPFSTFTRHASMIESFTSKAVTFMEKILTASGLSEETYLPPALHCIPPKPYHGEALEESQMVVFPVMEELFHKTRLSPFDIDVLILNCSGFCPSPSLCSTVINKFKLREDIKSYNLSGMGCSASALAIDMAQNLLKTCKNSYAVVVSTEILSTGWYSGNERPKLLLNCLFRMGTAAVLLTNKRQGREFSKFRLTRTLRTQTAHDDKSHLSVFREEDSAGKLGVTLKQDLFHVARDILRSHIFMVGVSVLPLSEKLRYVINRYCGIIFMKSEEIFVPNFKTVIQHFCFPTPGKPLIEDIGKTLKLGERDMEAAFMTFHRFGNQSSSSLWYQLCYLESKKRLRKGDKVWQVGMGSGLKCCSVIWECLRSDEEEDCKWGPWAD